MIGSLNWLPISTHPYIAAITNPLAKFISNSTEGYIEATKRATRYLKSTHDLGITFHSTSNSHLQAFMKFPINELTEFVDANCSHQD